MGHNPDDIEERMNFISDLPRKNQDLFLDEIWNQLYDKRKLEEKEGSKENSAIQEESKGG